MYYLKKIAVTLVLFPLWTVLIVSCSDTEDNSDPINTSENTVKEISSSDTTTSESCTTDQVLDTSRGECTVTLSISPAYGE